MKRLLLAALLFFGIAHGAHAAGPWIVNNFESDVTVGRDTRLEITERIFVTFDVQKHGIFRDIPTAYFDKYGQPYNIRLQVRSVTDAADHPLTYELQREGDMLRIRIGDADRYVDGAQSYVIHYSVQRAYNIQDDGASVEIPWNVTGTWEVPMQNAKATFHLPSQTGKIESICFTGPQGSKAKDCMIQQEGDTVTAIATNGIPYGSQLTASIKIPAPTMAVPGPVEQALWFLMDNYMLFYAISCTLLILILWMVYGKDYPLDSIMPRWEVPGMTPFDTQLLRREVLTTKDITAGIMYLATRGYLTIEKAGKGYAFYKKKNGDDLEPGEKALLHGLFPAKDVATTDSLKNKFYTNIALIKKAAVQNIITKGWFRSDPMDVTAGYIVLGVFLCGAGVFISIATEQGFSTLANMMAGMLWFIMSLHMPKKTLEGRRRQAEVLGLEEYIRRAEVLRLKIKNPPGHTRAEFDRLLPYAMIFGLENEWSRQFQDVLDQPADWMTGDTSNFTGTNFLYGLHAFQRSSVGTLTSQPPSVSSSSSYSSSGGSSFSSGGSSGGGFGGGGGGSW